jgi:hypothetical protein
MSDESRVFVVQKPARFDRTLTPPRFVPMYDFTPAEAHGRLVIVLGPGNIFQHRMSQALAQIRTVLANYSERDFIIAVGDPVAIAASVMVAAERTGGRVNLLRWDRLTKSYESFAIVVTP